MCTKAQEQVLAATVRPLLSLLVCLVPVRIRNQCFPTVFHRQVHICFEIIRSMRSEEDIAKIWDRLCLHRGPPHSKDLALDYPVQPGDILTMSYPRSGRTWLTHILWSLHHNGQVFPEGRMLYKEYPWLEMEGTDALLKIPAPRVLTSHLPMDLVPKSPEAKYICIVRNPKDVAVSYFYHQMGFGFTDQIEWKKNEDFDAYLKEFLDGTLVHGSYFDHLRSYLPYVGDSNCMMIFYEDLVSDGHKTITNLANFLGIDIVKDPADLVKAVQESSSINEMRKRQDRFFPAFAWKKKEYGFVRKGKSGGWQQNMTRDQSDAIDKKFQEEMGETDAAKWWTTLMQWK